MELEPLMMNVPPRVRFGFTKASDTPAEAIEDVV